MQHINHNEPDVYFYHSDHLGSASWITDNSGIAVQHLQYLPYGEPFVDQRMSGYSERFTFTGKDPRKGWRTPLNQIKCSEQRDEETGYGYFGARYMDYELMTMWLSIDPMADKYPGISPYAYCVWNPVRLVDPDGKEIWIGTHNGKRSKYIPNRKWNSGVAAALDKIYESKAGKFVIDYLINSKNKYYISGEANPSGNENPGYVDANNQIYLNTKKHKYNYLTLAHELFHAFQDENGVHGKLRSKEVEAFLFAGIVVTQINPGKDVFSLIEVMPPGMSDAYSALNTMTDNGKKYQSAMKSLTKEFSARQMGIAVSRFLNYSVEGNRYRNGYGYCGGDGVWYHPATSLLNKFSQYLY